MEIWGIENSGGEGGILRTPHKPRAIPLFFFEFQLGIHRFAIKNGK
jgi:hypothetical protein